MHSSGSLSISAFLSHFDSFGASISLNHRSRPSYQTGLGGLCTLAARALIFAFFLQILVQISQHESDITSTTSFIGSYSDQRRLRLTDEQFDFTIRLENPWVPEEEFDTYVNVAVKASTLKWDGDQVELIETEMEQEVCQKGRFSDYEFFRMQEESGVRNLCQKNLSMELYRSFTALESSFSSVQVSRCSQSLLSSRGLGHLRCKSAAQIDQFINNSSYYLLLMGKFFDTEEFGGEPIKPYGELIQDQLRAEELSVVSYRVSQNIAEIQDSWLQSYYGTQRRFYYKPSQPLKVVSGREELLLSVMFFVDENFEKISRVRKNVLGGLAETGGLIEIIFLCIELLIGRYQTFAYTSKLIQELFQVEKKVEKVNQVGSISQPGLFQNSLESKVLTSIHANLASQSPFRLSFLSFSLASLLQCCSPRHKRRLSLFRQGKQRVDSALDVVGLVKRLRKLKVISRATLPKHKAAFIPYFRENVLKPRDGKEKILKAISESFLTVKSPKGSLQASSREKFALKLAKEAAQEDLVSKHVLESLIEGFQSMVEEEEQRVLGKGLTNDSKGEDWDALIEEMKEKIGGDKHL